MVEKLDPHPSAPAQVVVLVGNPTGHGSAQQLAHRLSTETGREVKVEIISWYQLEPAHHDGARSLSRQQPPTKPTATGAVSKPALLRRKARSALIRAERATIPHRFAVNARRDAAAHQMLREADLVVILDNRALLTGWLAGRARPSVPVLNGLPAATRHLRGS